VQEILQALRLPAFARLVVSYTLNDLAHFVATIALSILVYDATRDPLATTALFLAAEFVPAFAIPPLVARLDGLRPTRLLASIYVLEAALLGTLAALASDFVLPAVLVLAFVNGTLASVGRAVTRAASVALLEPVGALRAGNAAMNVGFAITSAGGPVVAGGLVAATDTGPALAATAGVFAVLAAFIARAKGIPAGKVEAAGWTSRLGEAFAHVRSNRLVRTLLIGQGVTLGLLTMAVPIQVVYAKESLGVGDAGYGIFVGAWGFGMVLGSALFARERRRPIWHLIVVSTAAMGLGYVGIAVAPGLAAACGAAVLGGLGNGIQWVSVVTALQEATEERFQARVAALFEAVATAAPGAGFLLGGATAALLSPRGSFAVAGAGVLVLLAGAGLVVRAHAGRAPGSAPTPAADPVAS
jgi:MFS family permease